MRGFFGTPTPAVVGHQGAPVEAPGNTPAGFTAAAGAGATWVELDVRRAADALVVHHDPRTPDGVPLIERTAAELGERGIWTLADVLASLPPGLGVDAEVKNLPGEPDFDEDNSLVAAMAPQLAADAGARPLMTSSFNPLTVAALAAALPEVPAGLIHSEGLRADAAFDLAQEFGARVLCPHADTPGLGEAYADAAHQAGYAIMVWTVDDPRRALGLAAAGVDAICTNDPGALVRALGRG